MSYQNLQDIFFFAYSIISIWLYGIGASISLYKYYQLYGFPWDGNNNMLIPTVIFTQPISLPYFWILFLLWDEQHFHFLSSVRLLLLRLRFALWWHVLLQHCWHTGLSSDPRRDSRIRSKFLLKPREREKRPETHATFDELLSCLVPHQWSPHPSNSAINRSFIKLSRQTGK